MSHQKRTKNKTKTHQMAKATARIHPHVKKDGTSQIYILVANGKKRNKIDVGYSVMKEHFVDGQVTKDNPNFRNINAKINAVLGEYQSKIEVSKLTDTEFSLNDHKVKSVPFYDFCNDELDKANVEAGTRRIYKVWLNRLKEYDKTTKTNEINSKWINNYKVYLEKNNIGKAALFTVFKILKKTIRAAVRDGILSENVFANVYTPKEPKCTKIKYLTPSELERFETAAFDPNNEPFKRCSLWQLYGSYSGLRISDWSIDNLPEYLKSNEIKLNQTKTKGDVSIPIFPRLQKVIKAILEIGKPPLSDFQHNTTLKTFAKIAKINKDMSSHFGRHTFGVYLAENDVPPQVAMKLLGHKNIRETMIYYELTHSKIASVVLDKLG